MKADEVLDQYRQGKRNFCGVKLRGQSFKGKNLSRADFSYADIRGANFTNANLLGANFHGAEAGLQHRWAIGLVLASWLISGISALFSVFPNYFVLLAVDISNRENFSVGITFLIVLTVFFIVTIRHGLAAGLFAVVGAGAVGGAVAVAGAGAGAVGGAFAFAIAFAFAVGGAFAFAFAVGGAGAFAVVMLGVYVGWRGLAGDEKHAWVRSFAIAFAATGGTSFRGASLTDADFTSATLKSTDFRSTDRSTILTRTSWKQAKKLDHVRPGTTYLRNAQLWQWLIGKGQNKNFERQDLRGVNLKGANLADVSFNGANLSEANLQDADLSRAKLVQTQLDETDLTGATLTGACIEDWGITSHTKFDGVRCEYVFMRAETKENPNRRRKPDNWNETFQDGDFADFIKPIADTLDLYHNQDVDPRAIAISFKQLAENNPEAEVQFVAMEKRGEDKLLFRAKTAALADKSELSSEYFRNYNQLKALSEGEINLLIAEKDHRICRLENMIETALNRPNFYAETYQNQGDTMSGKSEDFSYNLSQAKFGGGFAGTGGTQTGGTLNDYSSNPSLSEAAAEIQQILNQLEVTNPTTTYAEKMIVAAKAVDEIEKNLVLKTRVISVLKSEGIKVFQEAINHPLAKNMMPFLEELAD